MRFFDRQEPIPASLIQLIPKNERLLAWTQTVTGFIAVTDVSLVSIDESSAKVIPWEFALQARWEPPELFVVVQSEQSELPKQLVFNLVTPGLVPIAVRDRVTAAVVIDQVEEITGVGRVRFIARRNKNGVNWTTVADDADLASTPGGTLEVNKVLGHLQATFGI